MASIVRDTQVLPGLRPASDRTIWKRFAAVLNGFRFSKPAGVEFPAAVEASESELEKLAKRGPVDRHDRQDVLVVLYGGGVIK